MILYTSDTHLGHAKVIGFSRRPFANVHHMDTAIIENLRAAEREPGLEMLVHCGDVSFNMAKAVETHGPLFASPVGKMVVCGNHDEIRDESRGNTRGARQLRAYLACFQHVVGEKRHWESQGAVIRDVLDGAEVTVIVSHAPLENLWGADVNVHGHLHNDILMAKPHREGFEWSYDSPVHFNAGTELHGFRPASLQALADVHRKRYAGAEKWLAPEPEAP